MKNQLLLFLIGLMSTFSGYSQSLMITEIMYNPPEKGTDKFEYVRITNLTIDPIDLLDYSFGGFSLEIDSSVILYPGDHLYLTESKELVDSIFSVESIQWSSGSLSNSGETISIINADGEVVDSVLYFKNKGWPTEANGQGYSIHYCPTGNADNNLASNWHLSDSLIMYNGDSVYVQSGSKCYQTVVNVNPLDEDKIEVSVYYDYIVIQVKEPFCVKAYDLTGREIFYSYAIGEKILRKDWLRSDIVLLNITTLHDSVIKKIHLYD